MGSFRRKQEVAVKEPEQKSFDAVIEGAFIGEWRKLHYKVARLEIPEGATSINDGDDIFLLQGKPRGKLEVVLDASLSMCKGLYVPYSGEIFPQLLENPRAIVMSDKRLFIGKHMLDDEEYMKAVQKTLLPSVARIFRDPNIPPLYEHLVNQQ